MVGWIISTVLDFYRIIPIPRPVILSELLIKVKTAYGQELSMNYVGNEVCSAFCAPFLLMSDRGSRINLSAW